MSARADKSIPVLSDIDKKILKILLVPDGNIQSSTIATKLGIPLSTIRRRRRRLENEFLKTTMSWILRNLDGDVLIFLFP